LYCFVAQSYAMNDLHPIFNRYPELKEFTRLLRYEIQQAQRPADEIVLTDYEVMKTFKMSKRKLDYLKANREITYSQPIPRSTCYFTLADLLKWLEKGRIESISEQIKI
jgi:hypothetical protein